VVKAPAC